MFKMTNQRFDVIEWDGTVHSVTSIGDQVVAVRYCDGVVHEVTRNYFDRVMKAKAVLRTDPFHHVEGCKCKK